MMSLGTTNKLFKGNHDLLILSEIKSKGAEKVGFTEGYDVDSEKWFNAASLFCRNNITKVFVFSK